MDDTLNVTKIFNLAGRSVKTVAAKYGISSGLVRLEIARGHLEAVRIGRRVIICDDAIQRWLEDGMQRSNFAAARESNERR